ncbi:UDP-N-acetylmuramate--L-alanine ligase [Desulfofundulus thermosubterraneus]|uniref:UDP-N-acetylmuramate--L-alanine ligase n=1 Tax=Desulfofundulus thermosubterraneus DSM 16057 TaxID=1121432 RepID=A0A1M6CDP4_9FIRM|nr:UDP-N-acetylmuramate--L-alanine ligase [Desulfofundulus thermosubterraneus]SHI58828.1 UDP-N-acetylmuramate--L-alanine ligase [Desulfofundulus thermosubterraneus DSM 16057]
MQVLPRRVHFIGIGGAGMSGLASILLDLGYEITGSDLSSTDITRRLESRGAVCHVGHASRNLDTTQLVVVSSAIKPDNAELLAAREKGIPVIHRGDLLAWLMQRQKGIAVAGAHGKTTTTSMLALVLEKSGLDPTIVIGGELNDIGGNAKLGRGEYLVAEADESDGSFLKLHPLAVIVTNIEDDHLDHYGSVAEIKKAFRQFMGNVPEYGLVIACIDDPNVREAVQDLGRPVITYGTESPAADYVLRHLLLEGEGSRGEVYYRDQHLGSLELSVPGKHNMLNALAVVAAARWIGLDFHLIAPILKEFRGARRRFELLGEVGNVRVVDDYAHHPSEIKATLQAARQTRPKRLIVVFQPHRYTRTALLKEQFGKSFGEADLVIVNEIYSAGEPPIEGVNAQLIVQAIKNHGRPPVVYLPAREQIVNYLAAMALPGDLILTMGAGNIWLCGLELLNRLREKTS